MARIFSRQYTHPFWDPDALEGPLKGASLREWEVAVILCSQYEEIDAALRRWLEAPTDRRRWPWSDTFPKQRAPLGPGDARQPLATVLKLFHEEITAIRQTLDFPIEVCFGISRDALLVRHGQRLRWLVSLLGRKRALKEIALLTQPGEAGAPHAAGNAA